MHVLPSFATMHASKVVDSYKSLILLTIIMSLTIVIIKNNSFNLERGEALPAW